MKEIRSKKTSKQIICIIVMIMLCNFMVPSYTYAADTDGGGKLFDRLIKFITFLCDSVMQFMQNSFTSNLSIENDDGTYDFQYSPGIIFSGTVQGLDINFITPNTDVRNSYNFEAWVKAKRPDFVSEMIEYEWEDYEKIDIPEDCERIREEVGEAHVGKVADFYTYYKVENNYLYIYFFAEYYYMDAYVQSEEPMWFYYYETNYEITDEFLKNMNALITYTSIAWELQPTIATWYNALRRIALVGLLSVLVYLGIRIVLSSSSAEGNSKYKKMLTDWLIALCLLFTLHYIMSATLVITQKLSSIFTVGTTDELLNTLRAGIKAGGSWGTVLAQVIMYVVIVIFTITFTFQYLRRVLYMAFFTMIAPLITLTYPIDKVKDGKAQAFNMWIREYIFNALIQVIHLIVYYTLVGSAIELVKSFPLYGIVAIGFLTQGEKIIRSMFGFNNAETIGTVGAAATGGLIVSGMNKLKSLSNGTKGAGKSASGGGSSSNVRTAKKNPLSSKKGGSGGSTASGGASTGSRNGVTTGASSRTKRTINGPAHIGKKIFKLAAGTALGLLAGGAGALIGFAGGVAEGDLSKAIGGGLAGGTAGMNLANRAVNLPGRVKSGIQDGWNNARDTYRVGAYGEEVAGAIKYDEEFRKGSTYKALQSNPNFSDESVQAMLDEGITDKKAMTAILDSGMDVDDAIKYHTVAQNCPNEIYYNDDMLRTFWKRTMGTEESNAERIRDMLGQFK